jgi:hypothetical protein
LFNFKIGIARAESSALPVLLIIWYGAMREEDGSVFFLRDCPCLLNERRPVRITLWLLLGISTQIPMPRP